MKKGSEVLGLIVLALFGIMIVWNLVSGIKGLTNSEFTGLSASAEVGKLCEVRAVGAEEVYTNVHFFKFIPTGKERFYLIKTEDGHSPLLVKQTALWYSRNFGVDGSAKKEVSITGEVKEFGSPAASELLGVKKRLQGSEIDISADRYINGNYRTLYWLWIISGVLIIAAVAGVIMILFHKGHVPLKAAAAVGILILAAVLFVGFVTVFGKTV